MKDAHIIKSIAIIKHKILNNFSKYLSKISDEIQKASDQGKFFIRIDCPGSYYKQLTDKLVEHKYKFIKLPNNKIEISWK